MASIVISAATNLETIISSAALSIWVAKSTAELFSVRVKVSGRSISRAPVSLATDSANFNNSALTWLSNHENANT